MHVGAQKAEVCILEAFLYLTDCWEAHRSHFLEVCCWPGAKNPPSRATGLSRVMEDAGAFRRIPQTDVSFSWISYSALSSLVTLAERPARCGGCRLLPTISSPAGLSSLLMGTSLHSQVLL